MVNNTTGQTEDGQTGYGGHSSLQTGDHARLRLSKKEFRKLR